MNEFNHIMYVIVGGFLLLFIWNGGVLAFGNHKEGSLSFRWARSPLHFRLPNWCKNIKLPNLNSPLVEAKPGCPDEEGGLVWKQPDIKYDLSYIFEITGFTDEIYIVALQLEHLKERFPIGWNIQYCSTVDKRPDVIDTNNIFIWSYRTWYWLLTKKN